MVQLESFRELFTTRTCFILPHSPFDEKCVALESEYLFKQKISINRREFSLNKVPTKRRVQDAQEKFNADNCLNESKSKNYANENLLAHKNESYLSNFIRNMERQERLKADEENVEKAKRKKKKKLKNSDENAGTVSDEKVNGNVVKQERDSVKNSSKNNNAGKRSNEKVNGNVVKKERDSVKNSSKKNNAGKMNNVNGNVVKNEGKGNAAIKNLSKVVDKNADGSVVVPKVERVENSNGDLVTDNPHSNGKSNKNKKSLQETSKSIDKNKKTTNPNAKQNENVGSVNSVGNKDPMNGTALGQNGKTVGNVIQNKGTKDLKNSAMGKQPNATIDALQANGTLDNPNLAQGQSVTDKPPVANAALKSNSNGTVNKSVKNNKKSIKKETTNGISQGGGATVNEAGGAGNSVVASVDGQGKTKTTGIMGRKERDHNKSSRLGVLGYEGHKVYENQVKSSFPSSCNGRSLVYDMWQKTKDFSSQCTEKMILQKGDDKSYSSDYQFVGHNNRSKGILTFRMGDGKRTVIDLEM